MKATRFLVHALAAAGIGAAIAATPASAAAHGRASPIVTFRAPVVVAPPQMALLPGTVVWYAPAVEAPLYFHAGFWWTPSGGAWYRAAAYQGPWVRVAPGFVPAAIVHMPARPHVGYLVNEPRVPYGQWKKAHWHPAPRHHRHGHGKR